jgi:hypothetical protein
MLAMISLVLLSLGVQGPAKHPVVCAKGVRTYNDLMEVPAPFDSLHLPSHAPIQVHSPEEAEAAEAQMLADAGKVGATGLVVMEVVDDDGSSRTVHRRVIPVFVAADTARAYGACRGK